MSKILNEEYSRIFSAIEADTNKLDELVTKELDDAGKAEVEKIEAEQVKRYARLDEIKKAIESRKKVAKYALESGEADTGYSPEGEKETKTFRKADADAGRKLDTAVEKEVVNLWSKGYTDPRLFSITTGTASGIFLPTSVVTPLAPTQDHVIARIQSKFGVTRETRPGTEKVNVPCPSPAAGGKITQGATNGSESAASFADSFTITPEPYGSGITYVDNTTALAPGYDFVANLLPTLQYNMVLGQESGDFTALKLGTNTYTLDSASAIEYEELMEIIRGLESHWLVGGLGLAASPDLYSAILAMTSDAGNKLVTVRDGDLYVSNVFIDQTAYLSGFGSGNKMGVLFHPRAVKLLDAGGVRLNRHTSDTRRDQEGYEIVQNHGVGFANEGTLVVKCPGS